MERYKPVRVFPSDRGLNFEFETEREAIAFHAKKQHLSDRYEIAGTIVTIRTSN